jgi:hypothetical protein
MFNIHYSLIIKKLNIAFKMRCTKLENWEFHGDEEDSSRGLLGSEAV